MYCLQMYFTLMTAMYYVLPMATTDRIVRRHRRKEVKRPHSLGEFGMPSVAEYASKSVVKPSALHDFGEQRNDLLLRYPLQVDNVSAVVGQRF